MLDRIGWTKLYDVSFGIPVFITGGPIKIAVNLYVSWGQCQQKSSAISTTLDNNRKELTKLIGALLRSSFAST